MRILILANLDVGLYKFRKELISEMIKSGNEVIIGVPKGELINELKKIGCKFIEIEVDRRGINPIKDFMLYRKYIQVLKAVEPDMVITYTIKPNIYGGIASSIKKVPYAVNITGLGTAFQKKNIIRALVINMYRIALKNAKVVFFENSSNKDAFEKFKICYKDKMYVLNGAGVNTEEFAYLEYPNNKVFKFLFIGRVMKEKGIEELFEAMKIIRKDGGKTVLDIVGPCEENYEIKMNEYIKEGWLVYHGYQENVKPFIAECDCFVLPSWHEGMANTNLECASSGRPIITCNIPGCREAIVDGVSGLLCKPKDYISLYNKMKDIMSMSNEERTEMGKEGRKHMKNVFEKKEIVKNTLAKLK